VGGTRDIRVSVRIIAATNKSLEREVEEGRFRRDLYFRLKVIPVEIPPLRKRLDDLLPLAELFVRHFNGEFSKSVRGVDAPAVRLMQTYGWPGNVRELRNAIERAVLLAEHAWVTPDDLPVEIRLGRGGEDDGLDSGNFTLPPGGLSIDELERDLLRQALVRTGGNRTRAARLLGMNRDRIRYRIQKYQLEDSVPGGD
jgi:DNA-binding NtrC family response regulator